MELFYGTAKRISKTIRGTFPQCAAVHAFPQPLVYIYIYIYIYIHPPTNTAVRTRLGVPCDYLNIMAAASTSTVCDVQRGAGAAEPGATALTTVADSVDLHELKVHKMRLVEDEYAWQNQLRKGQKLECRLVAADGGYCQGVFKALPRSGLRGDGRDPAVELKDMQDKFKDGTVWRMTKVALANEE